MRIVECKGDVYFDFNKKKKKNSNTKKYNGSLESKYKIDERNVHFH